MNLDQLRAAGFDRSEHIPFTRTYRVRCSACDALVINGTACHETACPQAMHECRGCSALIPTRARWCADCAM